MPDRVLLWQAWMIHLVREGSSSAAAESAIDWAARQVMDWIYPVSGKAGAPTRHTHAQELEKSSLHVSSVYKFHAHSTHKHSDILFVWQTCVTLGRHLDSKDQRQWCIVSSCVDREKKQDKKEIVLW